MCLCSGRGAKTQLAIEAFANKRTKDELDDALATFFFSSAIAFNAARNEGVQGHDQDGQPGGSGQADRH